MRIVYMGSSSLSCPCLEALLAGPDEIAAVVTQPDRPRGRRQKLTPCEVKVAAETRDVPVLTPVDVNTPESLSGLRALRPDVMVVVAYGQKLGAEILSLPPRGCINVHSSLLPAYRGAAPVHWAVANGETGTGVTTMFMSERMDGGDIMMQKKVAILPEDTAGTLQEKLAEAGADLIVETLEALRDGRAPRIPQDDSKATFAPKLKKEDGRIDWTRPAIDIYNRIRGFSPWPSSFTDLPAGEGRLKVLRAEVVEASGKPGEILDVSGEGPVVGTREGSLKLAQVQREGRGAVTGAEFLRGFSLNAGDVLGRE